jgi:hypothetical protein
MRKAVLYFFFSLVLFSCEKDSFVPSDEIPGWLKKRISHDEQLIKDSPKYMASYGAWLRYQWKDEFYFEYHNPLSSSSTVPITFDGDSLKIFSNINDQAYGKGRCCRQYVWKAPKFNALFE